MVRVCKLMPISPGVSWRDSIKSIGGETVAGQDFGNVELLLGLLFNLIDYLTASVLEQNQ